MATWQYYIVYIFYHRIFFKDEMNLTENLRKPIRTREMAIKVDMLSQFMRRQNTKVNFFCPIQFSKSHLILSRRITVIISYYYQVSSGPESPGDYKSQLTKNDFDHGELLQLLQSLRVNLTGRPIRYVIYAYNIHVYCIHLATTVELTFFLIISWIREFGSEGLECILNHLRSYICRYANVFLTEQ